MQNLSLSTLADLIIGYSNGSIVGATLAVVPAPDMHVGVGCRKGSPYAMISRDIVI